eukprot:3865770-Amphidinium_carterae.1
MVDSAFGWIGNHFTCTCPAEFYNMFPHVRLAIVLDSSRLSWLAPQIIRAQPGATHNKVNHALL